MERTISIRGTGRISVRPDTAEVTFLVAARDKDYAKAMTEQERLRSGLFSTLEELGFDEKELKTSFFGVSASYEGVEVNGEYRSVFAGYRAEHRMLLRFPLDTEKLGAVLSAISACVAEPEISIRFTAADPNAEAEKLLALAAEDARAKALALAAASGCKLGTLVRIDHGGGAPVFVSQTNYDCRIMQAKCESAGFEPMDIDAEESALFVWELE